MKTQHYNKLLYLLQNCTTLRELKQLHGVMITTSLIKHVIPLSRLVDFCTNSPNLSNLTYAESVFTHIDNPSVYIWNSMIRGHCNSNNSVKALLMYKQMMHLGHCPDHFTFPSVLKSCAATAKTSKTDRNYGECVHGRIIKTGFELDSYASTSLMHFYCVIGDVDLGEKVFDEMPKRNVVAWTTLIAGYVDSYRGGDAIRLFREMEVQNVEPNEVTFANVLAACGQCRDLETGRFVHGIVRQIGFRSSGMNSSMNIVLSTAILDMYAKCGSLNVARELFNKMPLRNLVAWNSMIGAYNQYDKPREAIELFVDMKNVGFSPDKVTLLSLLGASAKLGALVLGQELHAYVEKTNFGSAVAVVTALMDMYCKIGDTHSALRIFDGLPKKDKLAWTSLIMGLVMNGQSEEALSLFDKMQRLEGVTPDHITYIGVLCACSYAGLVDEGIKHFMSMKDLYGLEPMEEHYGCMVDLLSRAGRLKEAEELVGKMPMKPNLAIWGALLNGCEIHENVDTAGTVGSHLMELRPESCGVYVLLSNIYARAKRWLEVSSARELIREKRIERTYGWSVIVT
ncbi:hypothetical protein Sjap_007798 [Stephania japonica]|uniref:Pentatricopeptide repeat-containing protein n=1 Tax=Stephania japonica TaxID=461633 RepID=A0AAP0JNP4_9MAGN